MSQAQQYTEFVGRYCTDLGQFVTQYPDRRTYTIDESDLAQWDLEAADRLTQHPDMVLSSLREAVKLEAPAAVDLADLRVAVTGIDPIDVPQLRSQQLGEYVAVTGRVSSISKVMPMSLVDTYECQQGDCHHHVDVPQTGSQRSTPPNQCPMCERKGVWELVDAETIDAQPITLTDREPEMATTQEVEFIVTDDLVNNVSVGDTAVVYGEYRIDSERTAGRTNDRMVETELDVAYIEPMGTTFDSFDPGRVDDIRTLAARDDIKQAVADSIAPSIHGLDDIKLAIALQLFGGIRHQLPAGPDRPGDINILLVGDPGTGKSAMIKAAAELAPKSVFASGKGTSAAGLTATAEQSNGGEWQLEAGALVLANGGLACVDEFDKMEDSARKSMHEALEGQQIPINKAGINTVLPAKCAVLAGANPAAETFEWGAPLSEQLNLGPALITRFDLIFPLVDDPDEARDAAIADALLTHGGDGHDPTIDADLLREYIAYARQEIEPTWTDDARQRAKEYFVDLRQQSADGSPISPRVNNDIRKLGEASARLRLGTEVTVDDVALAIDLKDRHIEHVGLDTDGNVSGNLLDGGRVTQRDRMHIVTQAIEDLGDATRQDIRDRCGERGLTERQVSETIDKLSSEGAIYSPERGVWRTA